MGKRNIPVVGLLLLAGLVYGLCYRTTIEIDSSPGRSFVLGILLLEDGIRFQFRDGLIFSDVPEGFQSGLTKETSVWVGYKTGAPPPDIGYAYVRRELNYRTVRPPPRGPTHVTIWKVRDFKVTKKRVTLD
jgi:hypothetical protein